MQHDARRQMHGDSNVNNSRNRSFCIKKSGHQCRTKYIENKYSNEIFIRLKCKLGRG